MSLLLSFEDIKRKHHDYTLYGELDLRHFIHTYFIPVYDKDLSFLGWKKLEENDYVDGEN